MAKYIKCEKSGGITLRGKVIAEGAYHMLAETEEVAWAADSSVITALSNLEIAVSDRTDETNDIEDVSKALQFLRGTPLPIVPPVFPDDSGLYFRGLGDCKPLTSGLNVIDIDFAENRLVNRIELWTDSGQYGEKSDFQVVDKTGTGVTLGLYPQAYFDAMGEVVLQNFGSAWQVHPGVVSAAEPGYKAAVYAGLTIRLNVTVATACNLYYNLYLHKETT